MIYTIVDATGEIAFELTAADPYMVDGVKHYPDVVALNTPAGCRFLEGAPPFVGWNDGQWHQRPARPQPWMTWNATTKQWADQRTLDQAKSEQWSQIEAARDAIVFGAFAWDSSVFPCDPTSTQRISGAVQMAQIAKAANQPFSAPFTLADNTVRVLNADQVIALGLVLGSFVLTAIATGQGLWTQLQAATTNDQVMAIVWTPA